MSKLFIFKDGLEVLKHNETKLYISKSIGLLEHDEVPEFRHVEKMIENFSLKRHIFNVNEIFIIRNSNSNEILFFDVFYEKLYLLQSEEILTGAFILFSTFIVVTTLNKDKKHFILNLHDLKTLTLPSSYNLNEISLILQDQIVSKHLHVNDNIEIEKDVSTIIFAEEPQLAYPSIFILQKKECTCYLDTVRENKKVKNKMFIDVYIDDLKLKFNSIFSLVEYMNDTFFNSIKVCSIGVDGNSIAEVFGN